jgi:hypothetical protein
MNIVMLSVGDYAGSGYQIKKSINSISKDVNIICVTKQKHPYGYNTDFILSEQNFNHIQELVNNSDIIHFKGDELPTKNWFGINIPNDKKIVITVGGSGFRRGLKSLNSRQWHPISEYLSKSDLRTAITPDLNYPEFFSLYTPHTIDSKSVKNFYNRNEEILIQHSPSNRIKKGTNNIILPALEKLKTDGYPIKIELLEGLSNKEVIERKKYSNIFIDQINEAGFYGMSTIESIQYGIPTFTYVNDKCLGFSDNIINLKNFPIVSFSDENDLYLKLKYYLNNLNELDLLSLKTKEYCDKTHSYEVIGSLWLKLYNELLGNVIEDKIIKFGRLSIDGNIKTTQSQNKDWWIKRRTL